MTGQNKRIWAMAVMASTIIVGNAFLISRAWVCGPLWVSILTTVVGLLSIFACAVAILVFTDPSTAG